MLPQFLLLALGTLVSEDLACITAGVLIAQGRIGFLEGTSGCLAGIVLGDILLFLSGRLIGRSALNLGLVRRFIPPEKVDQASSWLSERGLKAVFISRFTPGLRLATYFAAGSLRTRFWTFALYFFAASILWTPLLVGSTVLFGDQFLRTLFGSGSHTPVAFAAASGALTVNLVLSRRILTCARWRELFGRLKRITRWEFWPPWLAYLPLVPYLLYLAVRHRSLTLFTAANPAIPAGGFAGESKSDILAQLSRVSDSIARFGAIPGGLTARARIETALDVMEKLQLSFPIVLKPDVGERGSGVEIIHSRREMERYLGQAPGSVILQQYIDGAEFGIFYYRYPHERRGRISSITEKTFPVVVGDGRRSVWELILGDARAVCIASAYARASKRSLSDVPISGERVKLVELGSHCRGAIFLDGSRWYTPALEAAIDEISQGYPGFYFGRFDVRAPSPEALACGVFTVLELNGVTAEATHVYDPAISLFEAYRVMFEQWRVAFRIGAVNRNRGMAPMPLPDFAQLLWARFKQ